MSERSTTNASPSDDHGAPRILVCSPGPQPVVEGALGAAGCKVTRVDDAESCLFKALQRDFDAIIVDEDQDDGNAVDLVGQLRGIDRYEGIPLLALVSTSSEDAVDALWNAGADDVVLKPVHGTALKMSLRGHLVRMRLLARERTFARNLSRYVSTRTLDAVRQLTETDRQPEPEERTVCVMFVDVRGSTSLSQEIDLGTLFSMLSGLLASQVECVHRHGGFVDKFGGDGVMAIFDGDTMAFEACRCALEMVEQAARGPVGRGGPPILPIGVGLHLGTVLIGNIGSEEHLDFSVIGESVNLAARLCSEAGAGEVVLSDEVREAAGEAPILEFTTPRKLSVKGISREVSAWTLAPSSGIDRHAKRSGAAPDGYERRGDGD